MTAEQLPEFVVTDSFNMNGRGTVYIGGCPIDLPPGETLVGRELKVSGGVKTVATCEIVRSPRYMERNCSMQGLRKGDPVGLIFDGDLK